ncbi:MAG TPA: tRNA lysidine(34) synthetase TilS [Leeuwenhoekiella sp.]|nr:tRNA lysidine(34) synthetase TilS [Leeuwenhoekiella sp.]
MIRIIGKIPQRVTVACSGGLDSMSVVNFLLEGKRKVQLAYFNHDTPHSKEAEDFVKKYAAKNKLILTVGRVRGSRGKLSLEEFWRNERYQFLTSLGSPYVITCHHLDDVVETWLFRCFHGNPGLIPYKRDPNIYRPFLMTEKKEFLKYAERRGLEWVEDPSNRMTKNIMRNHIRHNVIPQVAKVNPGIRTTIRKKLIEIYQNI